MFLDAKRLFRYVLVPGALLAASILAAVACGGDDGGEAAPGSPAAAAYTLQPVSGPPVLGANRIALVITDADQLPVDAENVQVSIFRISGNTGELVARVTPTERRVEEFFPHIHEGGTVHPHPDTTILYTIDNFNFDLPGLWGFQLNAVLSDGRQIALQSEPFDVGPATWPTAGKAAPATKTSTVRDVSDVAEIDSSNPPRPYMHELSVADALQQHKPFAVTFSTPAFCRTAVCGPVTDMVASFYEQYKDRMAFIHVEPYDLKKARAGQGLEVLPFIDQEWRIPSEPWTFVVGADGKVVAEFGGLFAAEELEAALKQAAGA